MPKSVPTRRQHKPSEDGYMLIAVMFMLAIFTIALAVAVPRMARQIQRDRELETVNRAKQYVRAVKMYYKKFGAYPPNLDALVQTNQIRFLRKKYVDPTTGKDEWKIIHFGQNKTQTTGFFGQPLAGASIAGAGPSGGNGLNGTSATDGTLGANGAPGTGGFFSTNTPGAVPGSTGDTSTSSGTSAAGPTGTTNPSGATDPNAPGGSSSGTGQTGQTFGGLGIIGVSPGSPKESIPVVKKKNHYNEWEFFYDPLVEQMMAGGGNLGNNGLTPVGSGTGTGSGTGSGTGFGGGSGFDSGSGFGGGAGSNPGGTSPTPPAPPQQ